MSEGTCGTETCAATKKNDSDCCNMHEEMLALADEAWMELMKEKIKAEIDKVSGAHMEKVAKLVMEANFAKWSDLMKSKARCNEYKDNLNTLMTEECGK